MARCSHCQGFGYKLKRRVDEDEYDCPWCEGTGIEEEKCHLCKGTGEINALTDQDYIFVASYADCPACDGTGRAQ